MVVWIERERKKRKGGQRKKNQEKRKNKSRVVCFTSLACSYLTLAFQKVDCSSTTACSRFQSLGMSTEFGPNPKIAEAARRAKEETITVFELGE